MRNRQLSKGFTLIELMIVVAIVAILAAIAYPSYTEQVARGRRADAKAALLETAQWLERQYTMSNSYLDPTTGRPRTLPELKAETASTYTLAYVTAPAASAPQANGYWLEMIPTGAMVNDRCGRFRVSNAGAKRLVPNSAGSDEASCWNK